ncbi:MAG: ATP synthase F0 subunit B [Desulfuromonadaceae bacterium]|jgi:F-type H+-transporting ATPase subunit b
MKIAEISMKRKLVPCVTCLLLVVFVAVAAASGGGGHEVDSGKLLKDFLYRLFNFAVTFGLLAYFVTKPIRNGLAGRREGIEQALEGARETQQKSEAKFAEYEDKLSKATQEIDEIYAAIKREGELEREKILANAREMAQKIEEEAKKSAAREIAHARIQLQREASELAISIAEDLLKKDFTGQDQSRLVDEFMQKVGELH